MIRLYTFEWIGTWDDNGLPIARRQTREQATAMREAGYATRVRRNLRGYYLSLIHI